MGCGPRSESAVLAPNCESAAGYWSSIVVATVSRWSTALPNVAALNGVQVFMQGACLTAGFNAQGAVSSNQVFATLGSL